ncbi:MAG: hypothetical protein HHAS10_02540 [Candidatus Altimarinota bacterium]
MIFLWGFSRFMILFPYPLLIDSNMNKKSSSEFSEAINQINNAILSTFNKYGRSCSAFYQIGEKGLLPERSILFVGMNPAGSRKGFQKWKGMKKDEYFKKNAMDISSYDRYYKIYSDNFGRSKKRDWNIIDLLAQRSSNQSKIANSIDLIINRKRKYRAEKLINAQYKIFLKLIGILKPKVIVVMNAKASEYIKFKQFRNQKKRIGKQGFWEMRLGKKQNLTIPILFTCPLSTGRPMDIGTREQLKWNIKRILKEMQNSPNK